MVKLEGGSAIAPQIRALVGAGIPVMGHLGFTPQSVNALSGHRVQGRQAEAADQLVAEALAVQERSEEHTSELQSRGHLVCRLLLEKKKYCLHCLELCLSTLMLHVCRRD